MASLVFSDTSSKQGLIQRCEFYTGLNDAGISGNTLLLQQFTGLINSWDGRIQTDILLSDGRWEYDDFNIGDMPIATTNLVSGQQDYSVKTDDNTRQIWKVSRVDIKDSSGNWTQLTQIDQQDISGGFSAYESTNGTPKQFDWNGVSLLLFPAPSYNSSGGLKIIFQRESDPFSVTGDDSKTPGFASAFHYLLALGASYDFAVANGKANVNHLRAELERGRDELKNFYASRNNQKTGLRVKQENNR